MNKYLGMKNKFKLLFLIGVLIFSSCEKIIDKSPEYQLDGSQRFKTIEDHELAINAAYKLFQQDSYYGSSGGSNAYALLPDMLSDNMNETGESLGNYVTLTAWFYAEDDANIDDTWSDAYQIISQINLTLRDIDKLSADNPGAVNRIKAQALVLRAMVHFDILRYWVDDYDRNSSSPSIPYITVFDREQKPSRGTVKETYDKIEADLTEAENLMANMDRPINDAGRAYADLDVIYALRARESLYSNQLDAAIDYATRVIDNYPLAPSVLFPLIWNDAANVEVIWSIVFNSGEDNVAGNAYFALTNRSSYRPNPTLVASYDPVNDVRFDSYFKIITSNGGTDRRVLSKFLAKQSAVDRPDGVVNFKVFRTGEMYLIRAEAYARKGGLDESFGLADLNELRAARIEGYVPEVLTGVALLDAIAFERRKELIGEGHRWFDLKRTSRTVARANCSDFCTLDPSDRAWTWPIPLTEINANANIQPQNPGY
jgi:starch-binding outer membrane protein, SusD/RagB family